MHAGERAGGVAGAERFGVEGFHQVGGAGVVGGPEGHEQVLRAGLREAPAQAEHAFARLRLPAAGIAGGEDGEPGLVQLQPGHLLRGEQAVVRRRGVGALLPGAERDRRPGEREQAARHGLAGQELRAILPRGRRGEVRQREIEAVRGEVEHVGGIDPAEVGLRGGAAPVDLDFDALRFRLGLEEACLPFRAGERAEQLAGDALAGRGRALGGEVRVIGIGKDDHPAAGGHGAGGLQQVAAAGNVAEVVGLAEEAPFGIEQRGEGDEIEVAIRADDELLDALRQ